MSSCMKAMEFSTSTDADRSKSLSPLGITGNSPISESVFWGRKPYQAGRLTRGNIRWALAQSQGIRNETTKQKERHGVATSVPENRWNGSNDREGEIPEKSKVLDAWVRAESSNQVKVWSGVEAYMVPNRINRLPVKLSRKMTDTGSEEKKPGKFIFEIDEDMGSVGWGRVARGCPLSVILLSYMSMYTGGGVDQGV
jgi:hypothetical protein